MEKTEKGQEEGQEEMKGEGMRKIPRLLPILLMGCLCQSVFAQSNDACQSDLRHLKLPDHALIDEGLGQPPVVFAFSQDGVDVYSAIDLKTRQIFQRFGTPSGRPFENVFTVILVYQDERIRQRKIESLRKMPHLPYNYYPHAPLKNLKFGAWEFELTPVWLDNVLTRKWLISQVQYFEPVSCEPVESRIPASSLLQGYLEASTECHNWVDGMILLENRRVPPDDNSVLSKAVEVMRHMLETHGLPN